MKFKIRNNSSKIEDTDKIFDSFVKWDKQFHRWVWLGLTITKNLIELMLGNIWVENDDNKEKSWVSFCFTLPLATKNLFDKSILIKENTDSLDKKVWEELNKYLGNDGKILIAEDELLNQVLLEKILEKFNISSNKIFSVNNWLEAVQDVEKDPNIKFIFMDAKMPNMSWLEATKRIRNIPNREIKIIAQTANTDYNDMKEFLDSWANGSIFKPINFMELAKIILDVLSQR